MFFKAGFSIEKGNVKMTKYYLFLNMNTQSSNVNMNAGDHPVSNEREVVVRSPFRNGSALCVRGVTRLRGADWRWEGLGAAGR